MTSSAVDPAELERIRRRIFLALFIALAVALHTLEALLPSPAPWFRLGFANILTLTALFLYGGRAAWSVTLARIAVGSLFLGTLFSPGFLLSLSGGVAAVALMTGARALAGRRLGPVGISVLGAAGHAAGQVLIAWLLLIRHDGIWTLFPFLLLFSLGTGIANGVAADLLLELLRGHPAFAGLAAPPPGEDEA
ncbi:MAG TPA: Gx transporter family protein [Desulfuromonadales bacterium]|jgi:heptaprenyl diphosphate synthase